MTAIEFTRWFLALFFCGVAAFYTVRILQTKRRRRSSPVFSGKLGTQHFATHMAFRVFRATILGVCLVRLVWPPFDQYLGVIDGLWHPVVLLLGDGLMLFGFSAVLVVHFQMGRRAGPVRRSTIQEGQRALSERLTPRYQLCPHSPGQPFLLN